MDGSDVPVIVLDTSVLIDSLTGSKRSEPVLREVIENGERLVIPSLVLYEWLRGPRLEVELANQEALFPEETALPFGPVEAAVAAELYKAVPQARGREIDLGVAACAIIRAAQLWTLNARDFRDIPGLRLAFNF